MAARASIASFSASVMGGAVATIWDSSPCHWIGRGVSRSLGNRLQDRTEGTGEVAHRLALDVVQPGHELP